MSYTEFSYQLIQAYDYYVLNRDHNCTIQLGGSDQWGNLTAGTELIRRKSGGEAFAVTTPLVTKSDGTKFGKTESGNLFIDAELTSPYKFYQFWINQSDEDAEKMIKIFTFLTKEEIEGLVATHKEAPHQRALQQRLAEEVTTLIHSKEAYDQAVAASNILFGKSTGEALKQLSEQDILDVFEGVPQHKVTRDALSNGVDVVDFFTDATGILPSKGEVKRALKENSLAVNKEKVKEEQTISAQDLLKGQVYHCPEGEEELFFSGGRIAIEN